MVRNTSLFRRRIPAPSIILISGAVTIQAGAIGVEFARFYRDLGADVTIVEFMERILPACDAEISDSVAKSFRKRGFKLLTPSAVTGMRRSEQGVTVTVEIEGQTSDITADRVISAAGVVGNVEELGLQTLGVAIERGHVKPMCGTDLGRGHLGNW